MGGGGWRRKQARKRNSTSWAWGKIFFLKKKLPCYMNDAKTFNCETRGVRQTLERLQRHDARGVYCTSGGFNASAGTCMSMASHNHITVQSLLKQMERSVNNSMVQCRMLELWIAIKSDTFQFFTREHFTLPFWCVCFFIIALYFHNIFQCFSFNSLEKLVT